MKTDLARGLAFLWLLSLWPAAYFVAGNFDQIADYDFEGVTGILLVSAAVPVAASLLAAALWSLRKRRAAIVVLFASAGLNPLLFCFRSFESTIVKLWAAGGFHHGMMAVYAALCASMALALGFALRKPVAQRAAVLAAVIVLAVNGALIAVDVHAFHAASSLPVPDALQAKRSPLHENIYYVLLDSYPGSVTTKRVFGFDNPLPEQLRQRGFFSAGDFRTNYFATMLTMSAVLDAYYDVTEASHFPIHGTEAYPIHLIGGYTPAAIKALKTIGFETLFLGNWYARCADKVFVCLDRWQISQSIPFGTFLDATPAARFFPPVVTMEAAGAAPFDALYDAITPLKDSIGALAAGHEHVFVLAHNMAPHPPTQYNADCTQSQAAPTVDLNWTDVEKDSYLAALHCVNRKLMLLIDEIDRRDPGALVVIQSDHGSFTQAHGHVAWDSLPAPLRDELTWPINFIRAPADCRHWLYDGIAQVNTMRFMIGCAMREPPHYLSDDSYIGRGRGTGDGPFVLLARQGPRYGG